MSSLETPAVIVTAIVSGQSIKAAMIVRTFIYHNALKTSDVLVRMVRENAVTVQNVRLEMSRRLHGATDVTPDTISPRRLRGVGKEYFVCNVNEPVVAVRVFYDGERTARQAFMSMIIEKLKSQRKGVDSGEPRRYNKVNPNRGVHGGNGESP